MSLNDYKRIKITQLMNSYNSEVNMLRQRLNNDINFVLRSSLKPVQKNAFINNMKNNYNLNVSRLRRKLDNDIRLINSLTSLTNQSKKALLVGINYRNTVNELSGCINDCLNIQQLLQTKYGYNDFVLLTDDTLVKPTKKSIIDELTNLLVNSKSGDKLFFLYSGHGIFTADLNGDETDGRDELIYPIDAFNLQGCISDDQLNSIIRSYLKPDTTLFVLMDCCFSGTILDLPYNYDTNNKLIVSKGQKETLGQVILISGCRDDQTSADAFVNLDGKNTFSGAMTYSFLKSIEPNISLNSLLTKMKSILKNEGYTQVPQLSTGKNIDIDSYVVTF